MCVCVFVGLLVGVGEWVGGCCVGVWVVWVGVPTQALHRPWRSQRNELHSHANSTIDNDRQRQGHAQNTMRHDEVNKMGAATETSSGNEQNGAVAYKHGTLHHT